MRSYPKLITILTGLALVGILTPDAWGQRRFQGNEPQLPSEIISAPRELAALIEEGKQAIGRSQWAEASLALGSVLGLEAQQGDDELDQDYFMEEANGLHYTKSLRSEARQLLENLPDAGQKFVELRYGVVAQKVLDDASAKGDWGALEELAQRYAFTSAGRNAAWILAEHYIADGHLFAAGMQFDRLLGQPRSRAEFGNALGVITAACWKGAGQQELARSALKRTLQYWPKTPMTWNGRALNLRDGNTREGDAELDAALGQLDLGPVALDQPRARQWLSNGGRPDNNAHSYAAPVMPIFRWDQEMHPSIQDQATVRSRMRDRGMDRSANIDVIPSRLPLVIDPWVVVRTYDQRTIGIDQRTGKKVWDSTFEGPPILFAPDPLFDRMDTMLDTSERVANSVWAEAPLGQLASNGKLLFGVCEISAVEAVENVVLGANIFRSAPRAPSNVLRAWSLESQGSLVWEVGSEKGLAEPELSGALFLGAPTPWEGQLLSLAEINGEVFLLGIQATDGKLLWKQQLVASATMPIASDTTRRQMAAVPAVYGRIVVCPTLSGYLVAYDLSTRSLLWAHHYEQTGQGAVRANVFGGMQYDAFEAMQSRSVEYAPLIANGVVVHMPCETDAVHYYAVDLLTGAPLWAQPRERYRYLGGVYEDTLLVIGDIQATGLRLRDGQKVWKDVDFTGARVVGRGARNRNEFFVPLSSQEMARLDMNEGKITQRYRVENSLGNLVATDRALVSVSPVDVRYYVLRERPNAATEIDALRDPTSAEAFAHQAELALGDGDLDKALELIKQAYRKAPKNNDITRVLTIIGIQAIKTDFTRFGPEVREFDALLSEGVDGTLFLTVMIDGFLKQNKFVEAFDKLMVLASDPLYNNYPGAEGNIFEPERGLTIQLDRWIRSQFLRIWKDSSADDRGEITKRIMPIMAQARHEVLHIKRRRMEMLLDLPVVAEISLAIAKELRRVADWSTADQFLCRLALHDDPEVRKQALQEQMSMYADLGRWSNAVRIRKQLGLPEVDIQPADPALSNNPPLPNDDSISSDMMPRADLGLISKRIMDWPEGNTVVDQRIRPEFRNQLDGVPFELHLEVGDHLQGWSVEQRLDSIRLTNPWGFESIDVPITLGSRSSSELLPVARAVNNMVFLELPNEIVAIDTLADNPQSADRWRHALDVDSKDGSMGGMGFGGFRQDVLERSLWGEQRRRVAKEATMIGATEYGVFVRHGDELVCLDLSSGKRIWTRRGLSRNPQLLREGDNILCWEPTLGQLSVYEARTGSFKEKRELPIGFELKSHRGDHLLLDRKLNDRRGQLQLWNWRTGAIVLDRSFETGTVGCITEGGSHWIAWEPNGKMYYWDLAGGKEWEHQLRAESRLQDIRAVAFDGCFLILPSSLQYRTDVFLLQPDRIRKVSGPIMAIKSSDGAPMWARSPVVYEYFFHWTQMRTSPVIALIRRFNWKITEPKIENRELLSVAFLDIRTGKTLYHSDVLPSVHGLGFSQRVDLARNRIVVEYAGQSFDIQFTNDEQPPFPVSDIGNLSSEDFRYMMSDPEFQRAFDQAFEDSSGGGNMAPMMPMQVPKR